jgi:hypothetical protein
MRTDVVSRHTKIPREGGNSLGSHQLEGGAVTRHDYTPGEPWITKLDSETWQQAALQRMHGLYPDEREELAAWAMEEDEKCLAGMSTVGNQFFKPAGISIASAAKESIQRQARLEWAEKARLAAEHEARLAVLRAEAEYRHRYLRPGVPQHVRDLAAVNLMTAEQLEERLLPEALEKLHPEIVAAICERYLKIEGIIELDRWGSL